MHCACELGHGFLESMYQEAPERKFVEQAIPDERALPISLSRQLLTPDFKNSAIEFGQPKSPITGDWSSICVYLRHLRILNFNSTICAQTLYKAIV